MAVVFLSTLSLSHRFREEILLMQEFTLFGRAFVVSEPLSICGRRCTSSYPCLHRQSQEMLTCTETGMLKKEADVSCLLSFHVLLIHPVSLDRNLTQIRFL